LHRICTAFAPHLHRICTAFILIAIPLLGISHFNYAQNTSGIAVYDQYRTQVSNIISPLDKSQIPTGYLYEYGYPAFHHTQLNGVRLDSNQISALTWRIVYSSTQSMHISGNSTMPSVADMQTITNPYQSNSENITFGVLHTRFARVKDNALANNLFYMQNNQLFDVTNRTQNPYENHEAFAVAPFVDETKDLAPTFLFKSDLFFNNYGANIAQIQSIQIDADNGQGWQNVVWNTPLQINYAQAGLKTLKYRFVFTNNTTKEGHSFLEVKNPPKQDLQRYSTSWDEEIRHPNGIAYIVYSSQNPQKRMRKPFIIAEGFDQAQIAPLLKKRGNYDLKQFLKQIRVKVEDNLNPNTTWLDGLIDDIGGYDLVFLDYKDGTADITGVNVPFFQYVLTEVKRQKELNTQQTGTPTFKNVVLGLSMGGLISRYGLAQYARGTGSDRAVAEDTRLLISYDSPHRGANIPLGFQGLMRQFADVTLFPGLDLVNQGTQGERIRQAIKVFDSPAFRQLVLYRATSPTGRDGNGNYDTEYNTFIDQVYQPMVHNVPNQPYQFIASSMGAECGTWNARGNDVFVDGGFWASEYAGLVKFHFTPVVRALPFQNANQTNEVAYLRVNRRALGFWFVGGLWGLIQIIIDETTSIYQENFYSPPNLLFLDGSPGGTLLSSDTFPYQTGLGYPTRQYSFVPQASALDVPLNTQSLLYTKYVSSYFNPSTQSQTNVQKYFTQEPTANPDPETTDGVVSPNLEHDQNPPARLGLWMFRQMEGISTDAQICNRPCSIDFPQVYIPITLCTENPYLITIPSGLNGFPFSVSTSNNLTATISGNQISVERTGDPRIKTGSITITVQVLCNVVLTFTQDIWINKPAGISAYLYYNTTAVITPAFDFFGLPTGVVNTISTSAQVPITVTFAGMNDAGVEWESDLYTVPGGFNGDPTLVISTPAEITCFYVRARVANGCGTSNWQQWNFCTRVPRIRPCVGRCLLETPRVALIAYPNPFIGDDFQIKIDGLEGIDYTKVTDQTPIGFDYNIRLQDDKGQILQTLTDNKIITKINMRGYQPGTYYAHVEADGVVKTIRVSKQ
jgi:hypothetical protein